MNAIQVVTTGRIVHFDRWSPDRIHIPATCRAAVVTQVWGEDGMVNLYVFPDGINEKGEVVTSVAHVETTVTDQHAWHWPQSHVGAKA